MRIIKKIGLFSVIILVIMYIVYRLGPVYPYVEFDAIPDETEYQITHLDSVIMRREVQCNIKPDNESRILWYNGIKKTQYGILYLHGWSASQGEGNPMHIQLAQRYGANLTLARLPGHGLVGDDVLLNTTAAEVVNYSKEIINIAAQTCENLIVLSCSTGSTLSAYLASADQRIKAQIMTSPNFGILDPTFDLLDRPWGLQIARLALHSEYNIWEPPSPEINKYWYTRYRIEGLVVCDQIVSNTMHDTVFTKIKIPTYIGYNYKNDEEKDKIIDVNLIQPFVETISTPKDLITTEAFTVCKHHVITNPDYCTDYHVVRASIEQFMENTLNIKPKLNVNVN